MLLTVAPSCGEAASLSFSHNSDEPPQAELEFKLTGSQMKTGHAIHLNIARMIREAGLERIGFLTVTVGNHVGPSEKGKLAPFVQVWEQAEASRRINNLNRRVLPALFVRAVIVTERHKSGAIHFHIVGEMAVDIRTGFDFEAFLSAREHRENGQGYEPHEKRYQDSASDELKAAWAMLRETLPAYGFGRAELTPIRKEGESIAGYVAKYVKKNLKARRAEDKGKKLVRYIGWNKGHCTSNSFSWASERATAWRNKARDLAALAMVDTRAKAGPAFGPRWSFKLTRIMHVVDDRALPEFLWTYPERELARQLVCREARRQWLRRAETENAAVPVEWRLAA